MAKFIDIARDMVARGLTIIPLHAKSKAAIEADWQAKGYRSEEQLEAWSTKNPDLNCGILCSKDTTWIFDVDNVPWFMDTFPKELMSSLETFAVKTGGGGYQFHFLQDDHSRTTLANKSIPNPNPDKYTKHGSQTKTVADILFDRKQGLAPGSTHPDSGKEYEVFKDKPLTVASVGLIAWVVGQTSKPTKEKDAVARSPFKLRPNFDVEAALKAGGLKYAKFEGDGKVFFNYHSEMGKCLVRGASHAQAGEDPNPRQSSFVWDPKSGQLWHACFSASCEPGIVNTKKALAELGINWREVFAADGARTVTRIPLSTVKKAHIQYLWQGYLPLNKLVHFAGGSTEGKSPVTVDLAARVSRGADWPDGTKNLLGPGNVILLAAEDNLEDTVVPRLELAGASLGNISTLQTKVTKGMDDVEKALALDEDMEALVAAIAETKGLRLVVIDPITNYLGKLSMNKEDEVRQALMPLSIACGQYDFCLVTVGHLNKRDKGTNPLQRIMGAAAFGGVARFIYFFGPDPEDDDKFSHVMVQARGVGGKSLRYATKATKLSWDGMESDVVGVEWRGYSEAVAEDAVDPASQKSKSQIKEAAKCLKDFLKTGEKPAQDCTEFLAQNGFVIDGGPNSREPGALDGGRVRTKAGVGTKQKDKKWWWFLKAAPTEQEGMF